jgi:hypothetical protein
VTYLELRDIDTLLDEQQLLAYAELIALGLGECGMHALPIDESLLTSAYVSSQLMADRQDLLEEPQFAFQLAKEEIESKIAEAAQKHSSALGDVYPFVIAPRPGVLLQRKPETSANLEGLCYLGLQIHLLYSEELLSFGLEPNQVGLDPAAAFTAPFAKLFEVISGIVVANHRRGIPVLLSESRSAATLRRALAVVCRISGQGRPKAGADLNLRQLKANDGGIDAVVLRFENGRLHDTALVGATVQKSNLSTKTIGPTQIGRFEGFLVDSTALRQISGSFAHPDPFKDSTRHVCAEANCHYYHRELIISHLHPLPGGSRFELICQKAARKAAAKQLQQLGQLYLRIGFDDLPFTHAALAAVAA